MILSTMYLEPRAHSHCVFKYSYLTTIYYSFCISLTISWSLVRHLFIYLVNLMKDNDGFVP